MAAESFKTKIFKSLQLSMLQFLSSIALRLVSTVVLSRLLAPEIYGIFAVVLLYIYVLEMISDVGFRALIVTREGELEDNFIRTCWTAQILRGLLIASLSWGIAALIWWGQAAEFFNPESAYAAAVLPLAIAGTSVISFIRGFESPAKMISERGMRFKAVTIAKIAENVITLVAMIALAVWLRSVWALVLGTLVGALVRVSLSFLLFKEGPKLYLHLNRSDLGIIFARGKWIMGHSTLTAVINQADRFFFGLIMSSTTFGFYFIARQMTGVVNSLLLSAHRQMGIQVFIHMLKAGDTEKFRQNYYKYRLFFDGIATLSVGFLMVASPLAVELIFDDRYLDVGPFVQVLTLELLFIGPGLLREAFSAQREFRAMTMLSLIRAASLWGGMAIAVFVFDSLTAALLVVALHRTPEILTLLYKGWQQGWVNLLKEIRLLPLVAIGAGLGWAVVWSWNALGF